MFQLYLPEMHMDAKLQVILKGILVTEEDGIKFSGFFSLFFYYFLKNHLLIIFMSPKDHWLSGPYITTMAAKRQGMRWRWVNMQIRSTCDLSYCMVMF